MLQVATSQRQEYLSIWVITGDQLYLKVLLHSSKRTKSSVVSSKGQITYFFTLHHHTLNYKFSVLSINSCPYICLLGATSVGHVLRNFPGYVKQQLPLDCSLREKHTCIISTCIIVEKSFEISSVLKVRLAPRVVQYIRRLLQEALNTKRIQKSKKHECQWDIMFTNIVSLPDSDSFVERRCCQARHGWTKSNIRDH